MCHTGAPVPEDMIFMQTYKVIIIVLIMLVITIITMAICCPRWWQIDHKGVTELHQISQNGAKCEIITPNG